MELVWLNLVKIVEQRILEDVAVQGGDAVDAVRADDGQVCHADRVAVYNRHAGDGVAVQVELVGQLAAEAVVDLHHNLVDAGQQGAEHILVPGLQRLGHDGVVGIGESVADDGPGLIPRVAALVQQDAHQLRDGQRRMGVVDVDGVFLGKVFQRAVELHVAAHDVRDGGRNQEVLLAQAQVFARRMVVVGVKHLADGLGVGVLAKGLGVVAAVEGVHIDGRALGAPDAQQADALAVIAGDHDVVWHRLDGGVVFVQDMVVAVVPELLDAAAEVDVHRMLGDALQPDFAAGQPLVGQLGLPAVDDLLLEDAEFVQDGVAHCWVAAGGQRVHKAGGKTSKAAVAKAGVRFQLKQVFHLDAHLLERLRKLGGKVEVVDRVL